jgi:hypothetical protein
MKLTRLFLSVISLLSMCYSRDGRQEGLVLGGGLGGGCDIVMPVVSILGESSSQKARINPAMLTDLKIGFNIGGRSEISIVSRNDWQMPYSTPIINNANCIEYRFYCKTAFPSIFFNGSVGYGFWFYPFDSDMNRYYAGRGISFFMGAGYEVRKNICLQFDIGYNRPVNTSNVPYFGMYSSGRVGFSQINHTLSFRLSAIYQVYH